MTIERRNPLPKGRYWVDVPLGKSEAFDRWLQQNATAVAIESRETLPTSNISMSVVHYIFACSQPVTWPTDRGFGLPSNATDAVQTHEDTVTRPPKPPSVTEQLESAFADVKTIALVAFLGYLWLRQDSRGRRR